MWTVVAVFPSLGKGESNTFWLTKVDFLSFWGHLGGARMEILFLGLRAILGFWCTESFLGLGGTGLSASCQRATASCFM